ncbi:MAG: divalent-cation tolerance protein CutA [Thermodesulfobacteria bacterium]|nr:divalent-cation tolerance protein CutA [Thermodesulfobacteriota bacterium]
MSKIVMVITTCGNREDAEKLARTLVEKRIAACAQVSGPITSFYWWEGNLEKDQEFQVKFKIPASLYSKAQETIRENHPYELPQIVAVEIDKALPDYESWIMAETDAE